MMLTTIKLLLLLQSVNYSSSTHALESPFNDNDLLELIKEISTEDYNAIMNQVENDLVRLRRYKDSTDYENHYLQYLFACFHKKFVAVCGNNHGLNSRFLGMLNEQGLLPTKFAEKFSKGIKYYALCSAFFTMPSPQRPLPIPDPNQDVNVPVILQHLFRNAQFEPLQVISNGQLMKIVMNYAHHYPVREESKTREVYFKRSKPAKLRTSRLKEAFFMLIANPFIQLVEGGFYQSTGQIVGGTNPSKNQLTTSLTNPPLALAPYYLIQVEHLYPVHLSIGSFYMVPEAALTPFNGPLHNPFAIGQSLPPPAGEDQVNLGQASGVKSYLIPVQFLYSAHLPTGRYRLIPGTALKAVYDQLPQQQQLGSPAPASASHASTKGHSSKTAVPPRQAYLIRPDDLHSVLLNNERFFMVSKKDLNFYEGDQPQQRQLDSPVHASASQYQSDIIDLEGLSDFDEDPVQMQRREMPQSPLQVLPHSSGQVPLQQQHQLNSPAPASTSQNHPDYIYLSGLSDFGEESAQMQEDEMFPFPLQEWPQSSEQMPLQQSQQQQLSSLSSAPEGPSSEGQFQAYQQQPMPPSIAVQQSPPVTATHPENTPPIQWSDADIEEFQWSDTDIEEFLQGMALPNQAVNGSGGSNGTSHQGHDEL